MRQFDYTEKWKKLLTPEIVRYLTTIHEYKGEQRLIAEHHADVLESLVEVAKIQSAESSNKIEGKDTNYCSYRCCRCHHSGKECHGVCTGLSAAGLIYKKHCV